MNFDEPDNPTKAAELFAERMNLLGYRLDFSLKSLNEEIDNIIDSELGIGPRRPDGWQEEANLEAYVGETLCRLFNGKWAGDFYQSKAGNFYTSFVLFDEYRFFPSHLFNTA